MRNWSNVRIAVVGAVVFTLTGAGVATGVDAITGKDIQNGSITPKDLSAKIKKQLKKKGQRGPAGERGPQGPKGDQGTPGITGTNGTDGANGTDGTNGTDGQDGRSALTPLQAGETIRGVIGLDTDSDGSGDYRAAASYPIPLASKPDSGFVNGVTTGENCDGSTAEPTAPAGVLCVYPSQANNPSLGADTHSVFLEGPNDSGKWGFRVSWNATGAGDTFFFGTWAYTAD